MALFVSITLMDILVNLWNGIIDFLATKWLFSTLPALCLIIWLGQVLGGIKLPGKFQFGVAGVFFVGVFFGIANPELHFHRDIERLGLVLFIYCVGLTAGPAFFQSFKKHGVRLNLATFVAITTIFFCCVGIYKVCKLDAVTVSGLFCGSLTNTPSLNAAKEAKRNADHDMVERLREEGKVAEAERLLGAIDNNVMGIDAGYGVVYPFSLVGVLLLIQICLARERRRNPDSGKLYEIAVVKVLNPPDDNGGEWTGALVNKVATVVAVRYRKDGEHFLVDGATPIPLGAEVVIEGAPVNVQEAIKLLGCAGDSDLLQDRAGLSTRFFTVSDHHLINCSVWDLPLSKIGATLCRIQRGDSPLEINSKTRLQLGDQVRVMLRPDQQNSIQSFFGNSLNMAMKHAFFSLFLGLALGLLIGQVPIPVPGCAVSVTLGYTGGPLLVALFFGALGRTGPFVWVIPPSGNLLLRQIGLAMVLAVIGVHSGSRMIETLRGDGLFLIGAGLAMMVFAHFLLWAVLRLCRVSYIPLLIGAMCGTQTQSAALGFASSRTDAMGANVGFATVFPLATILKIIYAQLLIVLFL